MAKVFTEKITTAKDPDVLPAHLNHTFVHLSTSGENWVAFFQVYLTVIRFSAP